jgi:RNA polymerase sigma factor (sigma-70 family)
VSELFPMTRPSAVADLLSGDVARRERTLQVIVRAYWRPVYKYIRLRYRSSAEEAEDLTQSFFEVAIQRATLSSYDPERARFRTFLRACLDRHVIDQHRRTTAQRRGGAYQHLDFSSAEAELAAAPGRDPEQAFEAEWLRHLMQLALEGLDAALAARDKPIHARLFRDFHVAADEPPTYAAAAARYGITTTDVTNWLHVARREFRRVALALLRDLTLDDADFADEARAVFGIDVATD